LTEAPSALPTALTSSSGSGSHQSTILRPLPCPFNGVGESFGISASAVASLTSWQPLPSNSSSLSADWRGCPSACSDFASPSPERSMTFTAAPVTGFSSSSATQSPWCHCSGSVLARPISGGRPMSSVIDIITEVSAMPSATQWWIRQIDALPPS
jgi:hypothetical protein